MEEAMERADAEEQPTASEEDILEVKNLQRPKAK